ncbi:hypothetical protein GQ457_10G008660 [Hibiscus cannabinus]
MDERKVKNKRKETWKCDIGLKINPRPKGDILLVDHVLEYTEFTYDIIKVKTLFFPTSKMEECRIILAEQDNLLTFSESQDRCHLGLRRLIGSRHFFIPDLKDEIVPNYLSRAG